MEKRDRSKGWKYAKLSGHENEKLVKEMIDSDGEYTDKLLKRIGKENQKINCTSIGGLHEKHVESINSKRKINSKTDLKIFLKNEDTVNISLKKSLTGQVYFVRAELFINAYEYRFGKEIPSPVKRAINLFWASAPDEAIDIIKKYGNEQKDKEYSMQLRHKSLNATTLKAYDEKLYNKLIEWFADNAYEITKMCFSMGSVKAEEEWSEFIWYKNMFGENDVDAIFSIEDICRAAKKFATEETYYGDENGGTTIQLPFGFVQWHQRKLQFHHDFKKICQISGTTKKPL